MANSLGNYNETFFAQEALIQLEKALGMAGRIHRGYNPDPQTKGDTIQIRRPSVFTAQDAPSTAQDLNPDSVAIQLTKWREVKIKLTDKDLTLSSDKIIEDHIRPAAVTLADDIDQNLVALYKDVPWVNSLSNPMILNDIADLRQVQFDNKVPLRDPSMLNYMIDGTNEAILLKALSASGQQANTQDPSLRQGSIGRLFGYDVFANQNTPKHTSGVAADFTGTVDGANVKGAKTLLFSAVTAGITYKIGDSFSISGHTQRYVITADGTDADGAAASVAFEPGLESATVGAEVITIKLTGAAKYQTLMFHRNAFALAMAPLSTLGADLGGARITTISDPITNLSLRARMFYEGNTSAVYVALDVLYGFKTLDRNLAVRGSQF